MRYLFIFITFACLLGAGPNTKVLRVAAYDLNPYVSRDRSEQGYLFEMVRRSFESQGYTLQVEFYPPLRAKHQVEIGAADILIPSYASPKDSSALIFSQPMHGSQVGYIHLQSEKTPDRREKLQLRQEFEEAFEQGGSLGDKAREETASSSASTDTLFGETDGVIQSSSDRIVRIIDMLASKRIRLAIADKFQVTDVLVNRRPNLIGKLKFVVPALASKDFHVAVSRKNAAHLRIVDDFNRGLQELRLSGEYENILVRYGHQIQPSDSETLSIGTVANADMKLLQDLSHHYTQKNPKVKFKWFILEETLLRRALLSNLALGENTFDIISLGNYDAPIYAKNGWLEALDPSEDYDVQDILEPVRAGLSYRGKLYGLPIYSESLMTYYRKDLFAKMGLKMPEQPTYAELETLAARLHQPDKKIYGLCMRGKPGWGQNGATITAIAHDFGATWLDSKNQPALQSPEWKAALTYYSRMAMQYGPPDVSSNGYLENLDLFAKGHCAMWFDATVAAGYLQNSKVSKVAKKTAFAKAPIHGKAKDAGWLWTWALAIPQGTQSSIQAKDFIAWATSKDYAKLVGRERSWSLAPSGTRVSTYAEPGYQKAAPFAAFVKSNIEARGKDSDSSENRQFVAIPEFTALGNSLGIYTSQLLSGRITVEEMQRMMQIESIKILKKVDEPAGSISNR